MATRDQIEHLLFSHPDMTYQEIGEIVERSRQRVGQVAQEARLTRKSRLQRRDITIEKVLDLYYHSDLLIKDIIAMFGCTETTITRRLRAGGISSSEVHSRKMKLRWRRIRGSREVMPIEEDARERPVYIKV